MHTQEIIRLMQQNEEPQQSYLPEIDQLLGEHPWFSIAHQLKLKILLAANNNQFNQSLPTVAAYTVNREQLYNFLYTPKQSIAHDDIELLAVELSPEYTFDAYEPSGIDSSEYVKPDDSACFVLDEQELLREKKKSTEELLDKFIASNPKIIPRAAEKPSVEVELSDSVEGIASELLAKVYMEQGFYKNALAVYKQLSLQNPEKRAYFASLIKDIKRLTEKND